MTLSLLTLLVLAQADAVPDAGSGPGPLITVDAGVITIAQSPLTWTPIVDAFGEFLARSPRDGVPFNAFSVPRVQAGLEAGWKGASARVLVEGVYATQGGALIGVAGDSVVVRLREAWGGYRLFFLEAQLGLVPTLVVPEVERAFLFRELSADGLESYRIKAPADFGANLRAHLPGKYGWVGVSVTNGEGYTSRRQEPRAGRRGAPVACWSAGAADGAGARAARLHWPVVGAGQSLRRRRVVAGPEAGRGRDGGVGAGVPRRWQSLRLVGCWPHTSGRPGTACNPPSESRSEISNHEFNRIGNFLSGANRVKNRYQNVELIGLDLQRQGIRA